MKKLLTTLIVVLLICIVSVFALTACGIELEEMDGNEYYSTTEKVRSVELIDEFFEETLNSPDFVVTCKDKDGVVRYTETVNGTSSYTLYKDGSKTYAFKKGDHFYVAQIKQVKNEAGETVETHTYYCSDSTKPGYYAGTQGNTMADMYLSDYCRFMNKHDGTGVVKELSEEGATFNCMTHIERVSHYPTGSLDFSYTTDRSSVTLTASSEGDKVNSLHLVINETAEGGRAEDLTWTFVYGNAAITLPDVDAWDK